MEELVSVVIPTYNRREILKETLLYLDNQTYPRDRFEVIVADDGSSDGTEEMVKSLKVSYNLKCHKHHHKGRAGTRNMGTYHARGEIFLFVDDHIYVDQRLIEEHVKFHRRFRSEGVRVVRGRVKFVKKRQDIPISPPYIEEKERKKTRLEQDPFRTFITNNISVEKEAFLSVGGFDEDFTEYGLQDAELGYRLHKARYRYKINPNAIGYIFPVGGGFKRKCDKRREIGHSSVLFCQKHPSLRMRLFLGVNPLVMGLHTLLTWNRWLVELARRKAEETSSKGKKDGVMESIFLFYLLAGGIKEKLREIKNSQNLRCLKDSKMTLSNR